MKGIVFSEFIELVEAQFGLAIADCIIEESDLKSEGAYTQVGTYDHQELIILISKLSQHTRIAESDLIKLFGEHLLQRFVALYPQFFDNIDNCFDFLDTIENRVHIEVKKLYPEAELPSFDSLQSGPTMQLIYRSNRPFSALAYGLIRGSASYFNEHIEIEMEDRSSDGKSFVVFTLTKIDSAFEATE